MAAKSFCQQEVLIDTNGKVLVVILIVIIIITSTSGYINSYYVFYL